MATGSATYHGDQVAHVSGDCSIDFLLCGRFNDVRNILLLWQQTIRIPPRDPRMFLAGSALRIKKGVITMTYSELVHGYTFVWVFFQYPVHEISKVFITVF